MQGLNVPLEKTFSSFLQDRLARCLERTGRKAETINFGVSGYGTAQELLTFRYDAAKYNPAVVVMAFYTNNDVYNNSRAVNPTDYPERSPYLSSTTTTSCWTTPSARCSRPIRRCRGVGVCRTWH